jgi:AhpD family alkylhydroperoxidase
VIRTDRPGHRGDAEFSATGFSATGFAAEVANRVDGLARRDHDGRVPHIDLPQLPGIVGLLAQYPQTAAPLNGLADALLRGPSSLSPADRETIAAYVSARNECTFCAETHGAVARHLHAADTHEATTLIAGPRTAGTNAVASQSPEARAAEQQAAEQQAGGSQQAAEQQVGGGSRHAAEQQAAKQQAGGGSQHATERHAAEQEVGGGSQHATEQHAAEQEVGGGQRVDDVLENGERAEVGAKLQALLAIAEKVRVDGRSVSAADIARAREAGADDKAIHDTVLIAAAFCMFNRYVDGLATLTPDQPEAYARHAKILAEGGYLQDTTRGR